MKIKKIDLKIRARITPLRERLYSHIKSAFFRDTTAQLLALPGIFLMVVAWILSFYYFQSSEYMLPTRYSSFLGVTNLGYWYNLYQLPFFLSLVSLINIVLANLIYKKDKFVSYILVSTNIFVAIIVIAIVISFGTLINS